MESAGFKLIEVLGGDPIIFKSYLLTFAFKSDHASHGVDSDAISIESLIMNRTLGQGLVRTGSPTATQKPKTTLT